jgi:OFA family oxalate/formate antiporter-like MFS transporter
VTNENINRRWIIAAAGVVMQLCLGSVYAWSIFKRPLMESHNWAETVTQGAFMIQTAMFAISVAIGGILVDKKGPLFTGLTGAVLFASGLMIAGYANSIGSIPLLYFGYGIVVGMGGGLGYSAPIATLIRWFPDKRGLVTGLAVMGYGFGSFAMGNLGPRAIIDFGITATFLGWGAISAVLVTSSAIFMRNPPQGFMSDRVCNINNVCSHEHSFTFSQAVHTWQYPVIWIILFLNVTAGLGFISQLSPMAQDVIKASMGPDLSPEMVKKAFIESGFILAIAAVFNGVGRLFWSWLSDVSGRRAVFFIILTVEAAGYSLLGHMVSPLMFTIISSVLLGCYGGIFSTLPAFVADQYGTANIGKIYGFIFTACGAAGIAGPYLFARIKEATGGFHIALYIQSVLLVFALILVAVYKKPEIPKS